MSIEQDIKAHGIEETKFNRAVEAMIPVVKEDYTFFESFLMDEYPDVMNEINDLKSLHNRFYPYNGSLHFDGEMFVLFGKKEDEIYDKWLEYVEDEAKRRVEG